MKTRYVLIAYLLLVIAILACNRTAPTATPLADAALSPTPSSLTGVPVPDMTYTPPGAAPTIVTPSLTDGTPDCVYDADFVADVTIFDDTELKPGTEFAKIWRMRNSGSCAWALGTEWSFESGDQMDGPESVGVPATEPGDTSDITVNLVAPDQAGTYTGFWQMVQPNGESFGTRGFVRIRVVDAQVTVTPTVSPTPTATSTPDSSPAIGYFGSDVDEADPGDTVTLEWRSTGATHATLYHLLATGQLGSFWEVGVSGVFDYHIDDRERNHTDFLLVVSDELGRSAQASLSIALRCPDTWFFAPAPGECPARPALVSAAAEENFERGVMIWVSEQDLIYVLFDDGQSPWWRVYTDKWNEGDPLDDPNITPPTGLYQPVRGFGLVWRDEPGVRERIGWALDSEAGFMTAVQSTSRPKYNDIYIGALDGEVWKLLPESSGWEKIP